jgi:hypothetical protein
MNDTQRSLYGPNTKLIEEVSHRLQSIPWFTRIETPHPDDSRLVRVTLEFLLDQPVDPWNGAAPDAQALTERKIIDSSRVSEQYLLQKAFHEPWTTGQADSVLDVLLHRYQSYYKDTHSYAHELLDFPARTIRCALYECLVDDITPKITFFRDLLPWFEQGYWPCGWRGRYPEGRLVLL